MKQLKSFADILKIRWEYVGGILGNMFEICCDMLGINREYVRNIFGEHVGGVWETY